MRLLVDTHVLIWWFTQPDQLSRRAVAALRNPANELVASAVSCYEIEYKRPVDRLLQRLPSAFEKAVIGEGFSWKTITPADATAAAQLPRHHGDPWDRILIAQAQSEGIPLVSADMRFELYAVDLIW